jgi:hypothetical protein
MAAAFKAAREAKEAQRLRYERDQAKRLEFEATLEAQEAQRLRYERNLAAHDRDQAAHERNQAAHEAYLLRKQLEVFKTCTFVEQALNSHKAAFEQAARRFPSEMRKLLACDRALLTTHHTPCVQQSGGRLRW